MSNENRTNINPPRRMRGPMGGGRMGSGEKAKDFKGTIDRIHIGSDLTTRNSMDLSHHH